MKLVSRRLRIILLLAALLGAVWSVRHLAAFSVTPDAIIQEFAARQGLPGGVIAFGAPGQPPTLTAFGITAGPKPRAIVGADRFRLASLSKPVTAATIMAMVGEGRLTLSDRLVDLLPEVRAARDPRMAAITVADLMRHSGGWDRAKAFDPHFITPADLTARLGTEARGGASALRSCPAVARAMLGQPLQFAPGTRFSYNNLGYCWLETVIEAKSGQEYEAAVRARLPEMRRLSTDPDTLTVMPPFRGGEARWLVADPRTIKAAGGWIGDAASYHAFASREPDARQLERPAYAQGDGVYGLGWRVWNRPQGRFLTHFGGMPGAFTLVMRKQGGRVLVVLFSGAPQNVDAAFATLFEALVQAEGW